MQHRTSPPRVGWLSLLGALLVLGFGLVFGSLALGLFPAAEDGLDGDAALGARLMAGGVAALALFAAIYLGATGLRGRRPDADDERGRIGQRWSVADGGSVTVYRQAIRRGLVNLAAAIAASLLIIAFTAGGVLTGNVGFVVIPVLMGLLIVPFTVKGLLQFLFDPVVLELGRSGIRVRGHRLVPWDDVKALRIEQYGSTRRRRVQGAETGPSTRRLGVVLRHDPSSFSLASALTGGAYSRIGVTEVELPVPIEEVLGRARAYHPELEVEGAPMPAGEVAAAREVRAFGHERADAEAVRWQGATMVPALVRRRLRDAARSLPAQLGSLGVVAIGLAASGAGAMIPLVLGIFAVFIGGIHVVSSGIGTLRAARAAADRRYTLTESFLVTESGEERHERRLAGLPPLVLSMERDGIGTISYQLPQPALPEWIRRLSLVPQRPTGVLLESIPDAERVFGMLRASAPAEGPGPAADAPTIVPVAGAEPGSSGPMLLPARPWTVQRVGAWIPWWFGLPFFLMGLSSLVLTIPGSQSGPMMLPLLLELLFAGIGAWVLWSNLSVALTHRRLLQSGTVVMARVIGLADGNARVHGVDQWTVRYEYDAGGRTQTGDSPMMSPADALHWAEGDRVNIAYDRVRPEVSIWLGGDPIETG